MVNQEALMAVVSSYLSDVSEVEWHAMVSGYIAGGGSAEPLSWTRVLLDHPVDHPLLNACYQEILSAFQDQSFAYDLLLPDSDEDLAVRSKGLVDWVQCFLSALGASGVWVAESQSSIVKEVLQDLNAVAQLNYQDIDHSEENENDFAQLYEYVRTLVMTLYLELQ